MTTPTPLPPDPAAAPPADPAAAPAADPAAAPPAPPSRWGRVVAVLPGLTTLSQFLLVTLLGTFAKCSVDDYTRDMERIKQVSTFNEVLADTLSVRAVTRQNLSLVTLDRMLKGSPKALPLSLFYVLDSGDDDSLVYNIAEEVYRARLATQPNIKIDNTLVLGRLGVAGRIMQRRDSSRYRRFLASVQQSVNAIKVISTPDAQTVQVQPTSAALPISPVNLPLAKAITNKGSSSVRRVYIQFRGYKRSVAQELQARLKKQEWETPNPERIDGSYGCTVRYFYAADLARAKEAQELAQTYFDTLPDKPQFKLLPVVEGKLPGVPPGQIEIWFGPPAPAR